MKIKCLIKCFVIALVAFAMVSGVICIGVGAVTDDYYDEVYEGPRKQDSEPEIDMDGQNDFIDSLLDAVTLTGTEVGPVEIEDGVRNVVLNNFTLTGDDAELKVGGGTTIRLTEGTTNNVPFIHSRGSLRVVGKGNLKTNTGLLAESGLLLLWHEGTITCDGGVIYNSSGAVYIRSGNTKLTRDEKGQCGNITAEGGDVFLEGGTIHADGENYGIASMYGKVEIGDATVKARGDEYAILSVTNEENINSIIISEKWKKRGYTVTLAKKEGSQNYYVLANSKGEPLYNSENMDAVVKVSKVEPAASGDASGDAEQFEIENYNDNGVIIAIVVICVSIIIMVVGIIKGIRNRRRF